MSYKGHIEPPSSIITSSDGNTKVEATVTGVNITGELGNLALGNSTIGCGDITSGDITSGDITSGDITSGAITSGAITSGAITSAGQVSGNTLIAQGQVSGNTVSAGRVKLTGSRKWFINQEVAHGFLQFSIQAGDLLVDTPIAEIQPVQQITNTGAGPDSHPIQLNFTGQHPCLMNISEDNTGLIVSSTDTYINEDNSISPTINESLPFCVLTTKEKDKSVFGVISFKEDSNVARKRPVGNFVSIFQRGTINEQRLFINSVGEGSLWVCNKDGSLESGDYISSTTVTGYGSKQSDDLLHNYTVAKITCNCDFSLTKNVKQKLKTIILSTDSEETFRQEMDYDSNGDLQYEDDLDEDGNQQMVYKYETRFLQADGTRLADEEDYLNRLSSGEPVYISCFVGCTYHCG